MAYIYEISSNPDYVGWMTKGQFEDEVKMREMGTDYVADTDKHEAQKQFFERMEPYGVVITQAHLVKGGDVIPTSIVFDKDFKKRFFRERYVQLKQKADTLTIEEFITDSYPLKDLVERIWDDLIFFNGESEHKLDYWIREYMKPGTEYFIGNVVYAH